MKSKSFYSMLTVKYPDFFPKQQPLKLAQKPNTETVWYSNA
jgi:hypothetical protein